MGGCTFMQMASGSSAQQAFEEACAQSRSEAEGDPDYDGYGYTGGIGEKSTFVMIPLPEGVDSQDRGAISLEADRLIQECDPRVDDKYGPAGCFELGDGKYFFFGWAPE